MTTLRGRVSWFGGPSDLGVSASEGLAFVYSYEQAPWLFLDQQPPNTTGLARRLNPEVFYIATRWDYSVTPKDMLLDMPVRVRAPSTGREIGGVTPADWGPHEDTERIADISPGLMAALGVGTDDVVEVTYLEGQGTHPMTPYSSICISSGHSTRCQGAIGILNEVEEATKVTDALSEALRIRGVEVQTFSDTVSMTQDENLNRIVDWHNAQMRELDISVHFNASDGEGHGTEVWYLTQEALATELSAAIATSGLTDRGSKHTNDLFVINHTDMPCVLLEIAFVDNEGDAEIYRDRFSEIIGALGDVLGGPAEAGRPPLRPERPQRPERPERPPPALPEVPRIDIRTNGPVVVSVNGRRQGRDI